MPSAARSETFALPAGSPAVKPAGSAQQPTAYVQTSIKNLGRDTSFQSSAGSYLLLEEGEQFDLTMDTQRISP